MSIHSIEQSLYKVITNNLHKIINLYMKNMEKEMAGIRT